ncbi:hypothetical protein ACN47E_006508 [Coniothyrium glycines]
MDAPKPSIEQSSSPRESVEEEDPLLSPTGSPAEHTLPIIAKTKKKPWILLIALAFAMVSIIDIGVDGSIPESMCKGDEIQQKMAMIFGWQDTFDAIPGILLAVPLGALADRVGRKWIFVASLMGLQLNSAFVLLICYFKSLPLQLTWFSSVFFFIGGGPIVAMAIGLTMISDVVPPEKRTTIFLYLTACVLLSEMLAPIMAARLMEYGDWLPMLLALGIQQVGVCLGFFFPETLHLRELPEPKDEAEEVLELQPKDGHFTLKAQMRNFRTIVDFLRSDRTLALVIFTFLANRLGRQALSLLIRYASKRYGWEIKKAAYLLSFRAATNLVAIAVFIPLANLFLLKKLRLPAHWADIWIARISIILTAIAAFVMGIAAHPALLIIGLLIFNLGTGYNAAMRSVAIHAVGGQASPDIAKLMSTIAIAESIGAMVAGPLLSELFQWGMDLGGFWLGLPFFGSAAFFSGIAFVTFAISVKDKEAAYIEVQDEDDSFFDEEGRASTSAFESSATHRQVN